MFQLRAPRTDYLAQMANDIKKLDERQRKKLNDEPYFGVYPKLMSKKEYNYYVNNTKIEVSSKNGLKRCLSSMAEPPIFKWQAWAVILVWDGA